MDDDPGRGGEHPIVTEAKEKKALRILPWGLFFLSLGLFAVAVPSATLRGWVAAAFGVLGGACGVASYLLIRRKS